MEYISQVVAALPVSLATAAIVIGALWPFIRRAIGTAVDKAITHQYDLKLEDRRLTNNSQIERIRAEYALSNARIAELIKREADYSLASWGRLRDAYMHVANMVDPHQTYEDIGAFGSDDDARNAMEIIGLNAPQISSVMSAPDRVAAFQRYCRLIRRQQAGDKAREFETYFDQHRVFLPQDVIDAFLSVSQCMWKVFHQYSVRHDYEGIHPVVSEKRIAEFELERDFSRHYDDKLQPIEAILRQRFSLDISSAGI